jgi:TRAP-type C4-dicarboxylate transport system permease small subunit
LSIKGEEGIAMLLKLDGYIEKIENVVIVACFILLILLTGGGFIARKLFSYTSMDLLSLQPALLLWLSLIGGSVAIKRGKHIRLEILLRVLPEHFKAWAYRIGGVFGMIVMLILLFLCRDFVASSIALSGWSGYLTMIMPIFFVVASFRFFLQILYPHP